MHVTLRDAWLHGGESCLGVENNLAQFAQVDEDTARTRWIGGTVAPILSRTDGIEGHAFAVGDLDQAGNQLARAGTQYRTDVLGELAGVAAGARERVRFGDDGILAEEVAPG